MVIACFVGTACERLHKAKAAAPNGAASSSEITSTAANAVENALVWAGELVSQGRNHKALYHLAPTLMGTLTKDVVERFKAAAKQCLGDELFASLEATPHVIDATGGGAEEAIELRDFRQGQHLEEGAAAASDDLEETLNPFGAR
ncbi:MAG: hypothetical protein EBU88_10510 [Acidobacteria bacterium]|nr:hypothetical protein [Acidobacteriota bacterium]